MASQEASLDPAIPSMRKSGRPSIFFAERTGLGFLCGMMPPRKYRTFCILAASVLTGWAADLPSPEPFLGDPPVAPAQAPAPEKRPRAAAASGFSVNTANREDVRTFYKTIYLASDGVPSGWNGNVGKGLAGDTSADFKQAIQRRINWFRAMAGVPANITLNPTYSQKAQQAALMMSANNALSHTPPNTWLFYTAAGAEAAGSSNLYLGRNGPSAITGYIDDPGANNGPVGHRRWILYPQTQLMGTGDVDGDSKYRRSNALWVFDSNIWGSRPSTRDQFVAWPPPGFVPYTTVFPRWSLSYPNADFSGATVTMKKNGVQISTTLETVKDGYGENTVVWLPQGQNFATKPKTDIVYSVQVSNVLVGGVPRTFSYDVKVFDPLAPVPDTTAPTLTITFPATNPYSTLATKFTVSGTATDNEKISRIEWRKQGEARWKAGTFSAKTGTWTAILSLNLGTGVYEFRALDGASNASAVATLTLTRKDEPPTITMTSPSGSTVQAQANRVTVEGTAADDIKVSKIEFKASTAKSWGTISFTQKTQSWKKAITVKKGSTTTYLFRAKDSIGQTSGEKTLQIVNN